MTSPFSRKELMRAAVHVVSTREAAGVDGLRPMHGRELGRHVHTLHQMLEGERYEPYYARKGLLRRRAKAPREHAISTLSDAVVLRAATSALAHVWTTIPESIAGGRPGVGANRVLDDVTAALAQGPRFVFRFDVRAAFASASFDEAITELRKRTERNDVVDLLVLWRRKQGQRFRGLAEGAAFAPLLLAVLLAGAASAVKTLHGLLRIWVDDGIFVTDRQEAALVAEMFIRGALKDLGGPVGMVLHADKTHCFTFDPSSNQVSPHGFLGVRWCGRWSEPMPDSVSGLFDELRVWATRRDWKTFEQTLLGWCASMLRDDTSPAWLQLLQERLNEAFPSRSPLLRHHFLVAARGPNGRSGPRVRSNVVFASGTSSVGRGIRRHVGGVASSSSSFSSSSLSGAHGSAQCAATNGAPEGTPHRPLVPASQSEAP